jgi:mono/diheme cytochrome c family protein
MQSLERRLPTESASPWSAAALIAAACWSIAIARADDRAGLPTTVGNTELGVKAIYDTRCAACHGKDLEGGFGPPLNDRAFRDAWRSRSKESMLQYISGSMPPGAGEILAPTQYSALVDYIDSVSHLAESRRLTVQDAHPVAG